MEMVGNDQGKQESQDLRAEKQMALKNGMMKEGKWGLDTKINSIWREMANNIRKMTMTFRRVKGKRVIQ